MDALTDVLRAMRLNANTYFCSDFAAPWGMRVDKANAAQFHALIEGECWLYVESMQQSIKLCAGDLVAFPTGGKHWLSDQNQVPQLTGAELLDALAQGHNPFEHDSPTNSQVTLLCGAFEYDSSINHPLLKELPCFIHIRSSEQTETLWLRPILEALAQESRDQGPGSQAVVDRLTEILFVAFLREYISGHPSEHGYLAALNDQKIGKALNLIHGDKASQLSIETLANEIGLTRGAFTQRFSKLLGMSPKAYLSQWRLNQAKTMLQANKSSSFDIALASGYSSEAAFSKAFKAQFGITPGAIRKQGFE